MKKGILCMVCAIASISIFACTPTPEQNKTGETVAMPQSDVVDEKLPDADAPILEIVSIYTVSEDGTAIEGSMDALEVKDADSIVNLLIQYGVLAEGTKVLSYETAGEAAEAGPGVVTVPGNEVESSMKQLGTLDISDLAVGESEKELTAQAIANTFIENTNVMQFTLKVNGEVVAENLNFQEAGK